MWGAAKGVFAPTYKVEPFCLSHGTLKRKGAIFPGEVKPFTFECLIFFYQMNIHFLQKGGG